MSKITKEIVTGCMGMRLKSIFEKIPSRYFEQMQEIRIRSGKPLIVRKGAEEFFVNADGSFGNSPEAALTAYRPEAADIHKILEFVSNYSLYALEEEIRNGYITIAGGHRLGLTGKAVLEHGSVKTLRNINGLNFRLSRQIKGCADSVMSSLVHRGREEICHTMIISPPCCGKTTLLRDIIRQISDGFGDFLGQAVGVVDERSEIAGCYHGEPQNDVGIRTDVLDACPKAEGMTMLLRSMSPRVIAVDEIGKPADIAAIEGIINAGIKLICTVHGKSLEDICKKPYLSELLGKEIFQRFIVLDKPGQIVGIYNYRLEPWESGCNDS